jgi:hypothetical protein
LLLRQWTLEHRRRPQNDAAAALFEAGLLTESEITELLAKWRGDFERASRRY